MKIRTIKVLNVLGIALIAVAGLYAVLALSARRSAERIFDTLEAEGRPMKLEGLMPAGIPDADNAALVYEDAVQQLRAGESGEEDLLSRLADAAAKMISNSPDADALEEFRRLYRSGAMAELLAAIEEGSLKPGYRQDLDLSQGFAMKLDHLWELMKLSRILAATVRLHAADGDQEAAWQAALTSLRVANALEEEPVLVSQLVRIASFRMTIDAIRHLDFTSGSFHPRLGEVDALLERFEDPAPIVTAVDTERISISEFLSDHPSEAVNLHGIGDGGGSIGNDIIARLYPLLPFLRDRDRAAYENIMGEYARNMMEPYSPDRDPGSGERLVDEMPSHYLLTKTLTPSIGSIKPRMLSMFAEAHVTRAGLAVLEHRHRTGAYPADLQTLDIVDAADPFSGKPLVYQSRPTGFTLYSLGEDGVDNGGVGVKEHKGDIAWIYSE